MLDAHSMETLTAVTRFHEALNRHDVASMMAIMSDGCVFENTYPPPDGERFVGKQAIQAFWENFFRASPNAIIEIEEIFALENRCVLRWLYRWLDANGKSGHVRGVDIFTVEMGKVTQKLSYVKG